MQTTETIRDRLQVGYLWTGKRSLFPLRLYGEKPAPRHIAFFDNDDEACGVRELILEYVESHGYKLGRAIAQAMIEYREALEHAGLAPDIDPDDAARQDHRAAMEAA